jgi:hypothetical protein
MPFCARVKNDGDGTGFVHAEYEPDKSSLASSASKIAANVRELSDVSIGVLGYS